MTKSGQKILIAKDGAWSTVKFDQKVDKNGNVVPDSGTSLDAFSAPNAGKYPLTVEQRTTVENILKTFQSDEAQLLVNTEFFKDNIELLRQKTEEAKSNKDKNAEENLKSQIKITEASLKKNKADYKNSSKLVTQANDLLAGKTKNTEEAIARLIQITENPEIVNSGMGGILEVENYKADLNPNPAPDPDTTTKKIEESQLTNSPSYQKSFAVDKTKYPRKPIDCELSFDGFDEILQAKKKEVKSDFFFGHSQEKMKAYFKNDDFIKCNAQVSKVGKKYYITLDFRIKSKDAKRTYGMLRANENIRFEMIDGTKVYCTSMIQDGGTIEAYTGNTLYSGIFEINKDDLGILKKSYIDNVGVIWSSGYEQYNIYNVDFLKNQLKCLEN